MTCLSSSVDKYYHLTNHVKFISAYLLNGNLTWLAVGAISTNKAHY